MFPLYPGVFNSPVLLVATTGPDRPVRMWTLSIESLSRRFPRPVVGGNACEYHTSHRSERLALFREYHASHRSARLALFRKYHTAHRSARLAFFQEYHASHHSARLRYFRKYHSYTKVKRVTKARYNLAQPNQLASRKHLSICIVWNNTWPIVRFRQCTIHHFCTCEYH